MGQLNAIIVPVTPFQQNCTILFDADDKSGVVVDPGGDVDRILAALEENAIRAGEIWITHGHIDHAGGAMDLKDALGIAVRNGIPVEAGALAGLDPHEIADPRPLVERIGAAAEAAGLPGRLGPKVSVVVDGGGCLPVDPDANEQPSSGRPAPDIPFKPELQEDNGSVRPSAPAPAAPPDDRP